MQLQKLVLGLAVGTTGLVAGLYAGFAVAINPAFAQLAAQPYVAAMQAINVVIVNPWFAIGFFGAPLLLPLAAWLHRRAHRQRWQLVAATLVFWVGSLGVTVLVNVPLNNQLAAVQWQRAPATAVQAARAHFAPAWNRWHTVRTLASVAAFGLAVAASLADTSHRRANRR
jgi:uncharacterized membrane protein